MKKYSVYIIIFLCLVVIWQFFMFNTITSREKHRSEFLEHYRVYSLELPDHLTFAGENVPLESEDVRERLDRELLVNVYWQSNTLLNIKRASRWFPVIEAILKKNGIPDDFKYVAMVESGFQNVTSPSGAQGFWQFLEETGKKYGLEINEYVDERYHVVKATEAACAYFKEAYGYFNNWTLTAASYNMGIGGIVNQLNKQKTASFYDLYLNIETSRYIFRILAAKLIFENPEDYGFYVLKSHLYKPYNTYQVIIDSPLTSLVDFALSQGITYRTLKLLNPWLRSTELPNKNKKVYYIDLPEKNSTVIEEEDKVGEPKKEEPVRIYEPKPDSIVYFTAERNMKLKEIAVLYHVSEAQLKEWNSLKSSKVKKGSRLRIIIRK
ncbi:MAG TPA: transglycosylase SLT domain-containing protein [Bacteroidia bacterium]|nr:transglycosylase SLT domain-containing protein [Bacteroidia bacterium]HRU68421.1 transglycosylase SLT domain-containing protein [Bacteroidia bacterium]